MTTPSTAYPPGVALPLDTELHGPHTPSAYTNGSPSLASAALPSAFQSTLIHEAQAETMSLQVKKLRPDAIPPTRGSKFSAGYDVYAVEDAVVPGREKAIVGTGVAVAIPVGTYARIAPRSGLAAKHSIATGAGVVDFDYRGEVKVILFNHSDTDFEIKKGDRMAQMVLERIVNPEVVVVEELEGTERGVGGFGSTGGFGRPSVPTAAGDGERADVVMQ